MSHDAVICFPPPCTPHAQTNMQIWIMLRMPPRLRRQPAAKTMTPWPSGNTKRSTCGLMFSHTIPGKPPKHAMLISLSKWPMLPTMALVIFFTAKHLQVWYKMQKLAVSNPASMYIVQSPKVRHQQVNVQHRHLNLQHEDCQLPWARLCNGWLECANAVCDAHNRAQSSVPCCGPQSGNINLSKTRRH